MESSRHDSDHLGPVFLLSHESDVTDVHSVFVRLDGSVYPRVVSSSAFNLNTVEMSSGFVEVQFPLFVNLDGVETSSSVVSVHFHSHSVTSCVSAEFTHENTSLASGVVAGFPGSNGEFLVSVHAGKVRSAGNPSSSGDAKEVESLLLLCRCSELESGGNLHVAVFNSHEVGASDHGLGSVFLGSVSKDSEFMGQAVVMVLSGSVSSGFTHHGDVDGTGSSVRVLGGSDEDLLFGDGNH